MRRLRARLLIRTLAGACGLFVAVGACAAIPSYLWCTSSEQMHLTCCCPELDGDRDALRAPCCESRSNTSPDATRAPDAAPRIGLAAATVIVAVLEWRAVLSEASQHPDRDTLARAGPRDRLHARHSIYLL